MPPKILHLSDLNFIIKMKELEYSNREIARKMGVCEGTIRYRLKRKATGVKDLRKDRPSGFSKYDAFIKEWISAYSEDKKRPTYKLLYDRLREEFGTKHSYDAFRRYMSKHFPEYHKKPTYIRLHTPPGALLQVDWKEDLKIQHKLSGNWIKVQALVFTLGFSSKLAVHFFFEKTLDAFIAGHQECFRKLGGLPEVLRTDCLKSAVLKYSGQKSELNDRYQSYLKRLKVDAFPSRPGQPTDKGKVEKRIRDLFYSLDLKHKIFKNLEDLNDYTDWKIAELEKDWSCSATGMSVQKSFEYEKDYLKNLPQHFPVIPVKEQYCKVRQDGTVAFCNNLYQVPSEYIHKTLLCINTGQRVIIYLDGTEIENYAYLPAAKRMVMLSEKALSDPEIGISDRVRFWGVEVAKRQLDYYQKIIKEA